MNSMEIGYFVKGLDVFLKNTQMTQKDFAEGVTSKVNLSNILNGNSGTSEKMRLALAKKAGLSIDELVNLGKTDMSHTNGNARVEPVAEPVEKEIVLDHDTIAAMNGLEIMNHTSTLKNDMLNTVLCFNKKLNDIISSLTKQRDDLMMMLSEHKASVNALEQPMITIKKNLTVVESNRAACEELSIFPGTKMPLGVEAIERLFITGRKEYLVLADRQAALYPITDNNGNVKFVVMAMKANQADHSVPIGRERRMAR